MKVNKMRVFLPKCERIERLELTELERAELAKRIAERGEAGLDDYIREERAREDSAVAKRIDSLKQKLAEREKEMEEELAREKEREREERKMRAGELQRDEDELERGFKILENARELRIREAALNVPLLKVIDAGERPEDGALARLWRKVKAFFVSILVAILKFLRWLGEMLGLVKKKKVVKKSEKGLSIALRLPFSAEEMSKLMSKFGNALFTNPDLEAHIEKRMIEEEKISSTRMKLRKLWDGEAYKRAAQRILEDEMERAAQKEKKRLKSENADLRKKKRELDRQREEMNKNIDDAYQKKLDEARRKVEDALKDEAINALKKELADGLEDAGYIDRSKGGISITSKLVSRFADLLYTEVIRDLASSKESDIGLDNPLGVYVKERPRIAEDASKVDIVGTVLASRINHPGDRRIYDEDMIVARELRGTTTHVVMLFDRSGSMEENKRLDAAKRACLALYKAILRQNPRNIVDLVAFDTRAEKLGIKDVWECESRGFTNMAEALAMARALFSRTRVDKKLLYLITDGLPEAYTIDGKQKIGDVAKSLERTLDEAKVMRSIAEKQGEITSTIIMLEPKEERYLESCLKIAKELSGTMLVTSPTELSKSMFRDYYSVKVPH